MIRTILLSLAMSAEIGSVPALAQEYASTVGFKPVVVPRPGDKGVYTLLDAYRQGQFVIAINKRVGPSGVSYTRRRINCSTGMARGLGTGETVAEMMLDRLDPNEAVPVTGSSAQLTSSAACRAVGL